MNLNLKEINKCLEENKNKIEEINSVKSERSKNYTDEDLFLLWSSYIQKMGLSPYLSPFDLTRKEYAYCMYKIFGKDSCKLFLKDTKLKKDLWNNKNSKRLAVDIVMTYRRRGYNFLRNTLKPKQETEWQKKYLASNYYGDLNELGMKKVKVLLNE